MEHNILVGAIVGLTVTSSFYVWNNNSFNKAQKSILLILFVFPPAQWLGILLVLFYNSYKINNSSEKVQERRVEQVRTNLNNSISNLTELKEKRILTEEEYKTKIEKIEAEKSEQNIKNSTEYKQLKSLLNSGVLTKDEFENKIQLLQNITEKEIDTKEITKTVDSLTKTYTESTEEKVGVKKQNLTSVYLALILSIILSFGGLMLFRDSNANNSETYILLLLTQQVTIRIVSIKKL